MSLDEVVQRFDLPQILRHNARFDMKKLQWLNGEYIRSMEKERYYKFGTAALEKAGINVSAFAPQYVKAALDTCQEKVKLFTDIPAFIDFYFRDVSEYEAESAKHFTPENKPRLQRLRDALFAELQRIPGVTPQRTLDHVRLGKADVIREVEGGGFRLAREVANTSLYHLMEVLGKERVLERLDRAINRIA